MYFQPGATSGGSGSLSGLFGEGGAESESSGGVLFVENSNATATEVASAGDSCVVAATAAANGTTVEVPIEYYAVMEGGTNETLPVLDYMMAEYVAYDLFSCATERVRRTLHPQRGGRALEDVGCVGVNSDPEEIATGESCDLPVEAGQSCTVVTGGVSLVVSDSSTEEAANTKAVDSINAAFTKNAFTNSSSQFYVKGLITLERRSVEEPVVAPATGTGTDGISMETSEAAVTPISTAGAIVLSLGLIAFIALALVALRHKRKRDSAYNEFDDDFDLVAKETDSTDDSLDDILRDLDNAYGNQVDVHHCTSATCPICTGRQTVFIPAGDNDTVSEMYPDEFEVDNNRNRSFEYKAKPGAKSPRFDNPAVIRPRLYEAEDTVDL